MTYETSTIEELEAKSLKEILRSVLIDQKVLAVQFDGGEVVIQPKRRLKPLPILDGHIPDGWKEAIYNESI
jgi:hypothetical protein